ncbi:PAS domain S-box protein [Alkalibacillus haloalkaliphilus]|uniref:PAS domain S-box protein n=1 Tax=Alkalibacillus haloalkaliphilus TaxID=94136 RepID=UPI0029363C1B|nr:PAS domain S-box protein [Alkalibacillus haloalkaliphilus]MDV2580698.1 PAS domain S-box protein [Alkalibacillus haloalkaliphilus]
MKNHVTFNDVNELFYDVEYGGIIEAANSWIDQNSMTVKTIYDESFNIIYITATVEDVFGYKQNELISKSIINYIHPEHRQSLYGCLENLEDNEKLRHEFRVLHKDGRYIDCQAHSGKIVDRKTGEHYYISVTQDIMAHKQAQQMLVSSEKLSTAGQLAASVAHEIRNPITSLKGFLQLLETGIEGKEAYLNIMKDEIEKIESISSELLYIAKPSPNEFKEANIVEMLEEVCMLMRSQARLEDVEVVLDSDLRSYMILCDRSQIKQVFINLIKNAIEAMHEPGVVTIKVTNDNCLSVEVIDQGEGVPDSLKERLGQPFLTTKDKGTGLGLMVTIDILQNHEAELLIRDREPKGSIFQVKFS